MKIGIAVLMLLLTTATAFADTTEALLGAWTTEGGKSQVEIFRCSEKICGKIISLREPRYADSKEGPPGALKVDSSNPDKALRQRPIVGLRIMEGFTATGAGSLGNGTIYDPENGKRYKCTIRLAGSNRLEVRGYIGISLLGRTTVWTR